MYRQLNHTQTKKQELKLLINKLKLENQGISKSLLDDKSLSEQQKTNKMVIYNTRLDIIKDLEKIYNS